MTAPARRPRQRAKTSQKLYDRARAALPGGVNSPVRSFGFVGGVPRFIASAHGDRLVDVDGNAYVDLVCSWGAVLLGHAHPAVVEAARSALEHGSSFGACTEQEVLLAEEISRRLAPVEQVRLVGSGTEATMSAVRLARAWTGRRLVLKFAGCYHGHVDALLAAAGSGGATLSLPDSPGAAGTEDTLVLPYNDKEALRAAMSRHGPQVACVIAEAAPANMGVIEPAEGWTAEIRSLCDAHGALFVSDEVLTGFRAGPAGWFGLEGVRPDLMTLGKVMGGGFPAAAFGGRADVMRLLAPEGPVYQAGTLAGNPVATAAGLAALRAAAEDAAGPGGGGRGVYARLGSAADAIVSILSEALSRKGVPHRFNRVGTLFSVFFGDAAVTDFASAKEAETFRYPPFFHSLLEDGVYAPPSPFEAWFVTAAHGASAVDQVRAAALRAAEAAGAARR